MFTTYSSSTFTIVGFRSCQCQETRRQKIVGIGDFPIFYFVDDGAVCGSLKGGIDTRFGGVGLWESVYRGSNLINKHHTNTSQLGLSPSSLTCFVGVDILTGDLCLWVKCVWMFCPLPLWFTWRGGGGRGLPPLSWFMNSWVKSSALWAAPALLDWSTVSQSPAPAWWEPLKRGVCLPAVGLRASLRTDPRRTVRVRLLPHLTIVSWASLWRRLSTSSPLTASRRSPASRPAASDREERFTWRTHFISELNKLITKWYNKKWIALPPSLTFPSLHPTHFYSSKLNCSTYLFYVFCENTRSERRCPDRGLHVHSSLHDTKHEHEHRATSSVIILLLIMIMISWNEIFTIVQWR